MMYNRGIEFALRVTSNNRGLYAKEVAHLMVKYTPEQRINAFWSKVNKDGSIPAHMPHLGKCWEWTAGMMRNGYGKVQYMKHTMPTNRMVWILINGVIPDGLWVLHKCDNRKCVNPDHLFLGTYRDNIDDMVSKGRTLKGALNCAPRGEKSPKAKITNQQVNEIRQYYAQGGITHAVLAKRYGIDTSTITKIINYKARKG